MSAQQRTNIDLRHNQILQRVIEKLASPPSSPVEGQEYYDTVLKIPRIWNGTLWLSFTSGGGTSYQGTISCSSNPNFPAAAKGDMWIVSTPGKIGGSSGTVVNIGDQIICNTDNSGGTLAAVGGDFDIVSGGVGTTRTYSTTIGNGVNSSFVVNHNLNSLNVLVQLSLVTGGNVINSDVVITDSMNVTVSFADVPGSGEIRVVVVG